MPNLPITRRSQIAAIAAAALLPLAACSGQGAAAPAASHGPAPSVAASSQIDAGRYLVEIGGCNDCHTVGYVETNGASPPESEWLTGAPVGFSGPWGVSYATNLRLYFQTLDEEDFIALARAGEGRPPMPWPSLMSMSDQDLRAIHAYVRSLGPKGEPTPAPLSPGQAPKTPHVNMMPVMPG